ncbi:MAG: hypothetical protein E7518_00480 [Ruminococcaceae bacterium]|nr:hypothetical protein [Oscillospiraceae bacterium]
MRNFSSKEIKRLTGELNKVAEDLECEMDEDNIMTLRFRAGVILENIRAFIRGCPIALYDSETKQPYLLYPDGSKSSHI